MENRDQDKELMDILKECTSFDTDPAVNKQQAMKTAAPAETPAAAEEPQEKPQRRTGRPENRVPVENRILAEMKANKAQKIAERQQAQEQYAIQVQQAALNGEELPPEPNLKAAKKPMMKKPAKQQTASASSQPKAAPKAEKAQAPKPDAAELKARKAAEKQAKKEAKQAKKEAKKASKEPKTVKPLRVLPKAVATVFSVLVVLCVLWVGMSIHPDTGTGTAAATEKTLNLAERLDVYMNNAASDALSNLTYIKKVLTIPESDLVAPMPDQSKFGETTDPMVVQAIVDEAAELLDGQTLIWNPDIQFWDGMPIKYYYDETILTIAWKELINGTMYSFCEVKIAHGSQLRRAISENTYGSSVYKYPTELAKSVNAVVATSADFYTYRDLGITVYQRQMYRHKPASVDTCFFTADGNMIFSRRGELSDKAEAEQFIKDNDVIFSAAFGPIVIENGEKQSWPNYGLGEVFSKYSRNIFSQAGELHYLMMTSNFEGPGQTPITLDTAANVLMTKGVDKAYALDGGQTASLVMNNKLINRVDWDKERTMSDIIYFATAVPNKEGE